MNDTSTTTTTLRCALARIAGLADDAATLSHGAALAILADIHERPRRRWSRSESMTSHREAAFQAFYDSLDDKGGIAGETLLRKAWEAGRKYEADRIESITRRNLLNTPLRPTDNR